VRSGEHGLGGMHQTCNRADAGSFAPRRARSISFLKDAVVIYLGTRTDSLLFAQNLQPPNPSSVWRDPRILFEQRLVGYVAAVCADEELVLRLLWNRKFL
jgi:hypothetical protein